MSSLSYTLPTILSIYMLFGVLRYKLWKRSITITIVIIGQVIAEPLFYFGYIDCAIGVMTTSILIAYFRSIGKDDTDTISGNIQRDRKTAIGRVKL